MRYLRRLLILSVPALTVASLGLEVVLRLAGYVPYFLDGRAFVPGPNAALLYTLRPNFRGLYAGLPICINSKGFRGREVSQQNGDPLFRVVIVGDSLAFGQGVPEGETLAEHLAAQLTRELGAPVEVANLGVPGYDTCQEYWRFKEQALPLGPRAAILVYHESDVDPQLFQVRDGAVVSPDVRTGLYGELMAAARKHSAAYNLVWTRWQLVKRRTSTIDGYSGDRERWFRDREHRFR